MMNGSTNRKVTGKPLFNLGVVVVSGDAADVMERQGLHPILLVARHASGDWGNVEGWHRLKNENNLAKGGPLFSVYKFGDDTLYVVSDSERTMTQITVPSDH